MFHFFQPMTISPAPGNGSAGKFLFIRKSLGASSVPKSHRNGNTQGIKSSRFEDSEKIFEPSPWLSRDGQESPWSRVRFKSILANLLARSGSKFNFCKDSRNNRSLSTFGVSVGTGKFHRQYRSGLDIGMADLSDLCGIESRCTA